jgi:hypothetical protein
MVRPWSGLCMMGRAGRRYNAWPPHTPKSQCPRSTDEPARSHGLQDPWRPKNASRSPPSCHIPVDSLGTPEPARHAAQRALPARKCRPPLPMAGCSLAARRPFAQMKRPIARRRCRPRCLSGQRRGSVSAASLQRLCHLCPLRCEQRDTRALAHAGHTPTLSATASAAFLAFLVGARVAGPLCNGQLAQTRSRSRRGEQHRST